VQRALERRLHPLLSVLPLCLFGTVLLVDFGALVSGFRIFAEVSYWVLASSLAIGLVVLVALFVDFTTAPTGSPAHRIRGLASATTAGMMVVFTLAWFVRTDAQPAGNAALFLMELFAFAGGLAGATLTRDPHAGRGLFEARPSVDWPFTAAS
jgi:uncharacterized membrane protein